MDEDKMVGYEHPASAPSDELTAPAGRRFRDKATMWLAFCVTYICLLAGCGANSVNSRDRGDGDEAAVIATSTTAPVREEGSMKIANVTNTNICEFVSTEAVRLSIYPNDAQAPSAVCESDVGRWGNDMYTPLFNAQYSFDLSSASSDYDYAAVQLLAIPDAANEEAQGSVRPGDSYFDGFQGELSRTVDFANQTFQCKYRTSPSMEILQVGHV